MNKQRTDKEGKATNMSSTITVRVEDKTKLRAIEDAENGKMAAFSSIDALMEDLND